MPYLYIALLLISLISGWLQWFWISYYAINAALLVSFADVLLQMIQTFRKKAGTDQVLTSVGVFLLMSSLMFHCCFWPSRRLLTYTILFFCIGIYIAKLILSRRTTLRFSLMISLTAIVLLFTQMRASQIFCIRYNLDVDNPKGEIGMRHHLAYLLSQGTNRFKAEPILLKEKAELSERLEKRTLSEKDKKRLEHDLYVVQKSISDYYKSGKFDYSPLHSE